MARKWLVIPSICLLMVQSRANSAPAAEMPKAKEYINSIGMKFVRIEAGCFLMGAGQAQANWDEQPAHKVTISVPFYMSETEVSVEQFQKFRSDFRGTEEFRPYAAGVSWYDAVEFCKWLGEKEGKIYRLPTEAEWEYACRSGVESSAGRKAVEPETANAWGLKNMLTGVREWCHDWYGEYLDGEQVDPVGRERGMTRVVRGGALDDVQETEKYARPSQRAGMAPGFGPYPNNLNNFGYHNIGFRVVEGQSPKSEPAAYEPSFPEQGVKQNVQIAKLGPDRAKPYFRKRYMLPTPPENCKREAIDAAGLHGGFRGHNHSPGFAVCPNGDLLLAIHTSYHEYEPEVAVMGSRLRFGAEEWDMPDILFDFPAAADPAPMLWNDNGRLYFFCGSPRLKNAFPFYWMTSTDNGVTWSEVKFPEFKNKVGPHSRQPINTALRDKNGVMYISSDGAGGTSVLWASADNGRSWYDTEGRSGGRHTTYVLLRDGGILGMGGKNTNIDGFMPKSISRDGGRTWDIGKTGFAALGSNQRPSVLRLASGRILFAGDFQHINGHQPEGVTESGSYVAHSEDEGQTWKIKKLIGTQPHENPSRHDGGDTIGYSVAREAPNGIVHLITTMNRPCLHFAFNEAWILRGDTKYEHMSDAGLMKSSATKITGVKRYEERYTSGKVRIRWGGGVGDDGRFLLHGTETWFYENGQKRREVSYDRGRKVGVEAYWLRDGRKKWIRGHREDGSRVWTQWWSNGREKAQSTWKDLKCEGMATCWDRSGKMTSRRKFVDGTMSEAELISEVRKVPTRRDYLAIVRAYADAMIKYGRDTYGKEDSPLFAATLDRHTLSLMSAAPKARLRNSERIIDGANPGQDQDLYQILYALAEVTGDKSYAEEADRALKWFFENCQSPTTGLMAWGEHLGWGFNTETVSFRRSNIHEFRGPWVLWDKSFELAARACVTFAHGLWDHQIHEYRGDFSRHGGWDRHYTEVGNGYPRHGGFYIVTWAEAYKRTKDATFLKAIETVLDHFNNTSSPQSGAIVCCTRSDRIHMMWPPSNLSLAIDLWEAAEKVPEGLANKMRQRALRTDEIYLSLDHDFGSGGKGFVMGANVHTLERFREVPWDVCDVWDYAGHAIQCYLRYRQVGRGGYRDLTLRAARRYLDIEPEYETVALQPTVMANAIKFMLIAYELTGNLNYLDRADHFAELGVEIFMDDSSPLPKGSSKHDHYEAYTGGDDLMKSLLEVWLVKNRPGLRAGLVYNSR